MNFRGFWGSIFQKFSKISNTYMPYNFKWNKNLIFSWCFTFQKLRHLQRQKCVTFLIRSPFPLGVNPLYWSPDCFQHFTFLSRLRDYYLHLLAQYLLNLRNIVNTLQFLHFHQREKSIHLQVSLIVLKTFLPSLSTGSGTSFKPDITTILNSLFW